MSEVLFTRDCSRVENVDTWGQGRWRGRGEMDGERGDGWREGRWMERGEMEGQRGDGGRGEMEGEKKRSFQW